MSEGLAASTVTPGRIAPLVSLTTPAIDAWAELSRGMRNTAALSSTKHDNARRILPPVVGDGRPQPLNVNGRPDLLASGETIAAGMAEDNQIRWDPRAGRHAIQRLVFPGWPGCLSQWQL